MVSRIESLTSLHSLKQKTLYEIPGESVEQELGKELKIKYVLNTRIVVVHGDHTVTCEVGEEVSVSQCRVVSVYQTKVKIKI